MSLQIKTVCKDNEERWQSFAFAHGTLYHDIAWARIIANTYALRSEYYLAEDNGETVGLLPFMRLNSGKVLSLPYLPFAGSIFLSVEDREHALALWREQLIGKRYHFMETRSVGRATENSLGYINMVVPLQADPTMAWQALRTKERNQVRHAESLGMQAKFGGQHINDFYRLYCQRMHDFGTPPHAVNWFTNILTIIPGANVLIIILNNSIIGAMFFIKHKDTIHVLYAVTETRSNHLCPNVFMYWEIFKHACAKQCASVDLGRTTFASPNFQFKKHWGGQPTELVYNSFNLSNDSTRALLPLQEDAGKKVMSRVWRCLPDFLHRRLGPKIRKYLP